MKYLPVLYLAVPLLGLVAGWATAPPADVAVAQGSASHRSGHRGDAGRPATVEDLVHSLNQRLGKPGEPGKDPLMLVLADWTDEEIRTALDESMLHPELMLGAGHSAGVTHNLFRLLIGRDFAAASAWFAALPQDRQNALSATLLWNWPADRPEEGLRFIRENRGLSIGRDQHILNINLTAAASRGSGHMLSFMRRLKEEGYGGGFETIYAVNAGVIAAVSFPRGFDFPGFLSSLEVNFTPQGGGAQGAALRAWKEQDRDAAFQWLLENHGAKVLQMAENPWDFTDGTSTWFSGKLAALQPAQRAEYLGGRLRSWTQDPGYARRLLQASSGTPVHQEILRHAVQGIFYGKYRDTLDLVSGLPDPGERLRFLENLQAMEQEEGFYMDTMQGEEAILRGKLHSWGADDVRAEAILTRLKSQRKKEGEDP